MKAVQFAEFGAPPAIVDVPEPACPPGGAVIEVRATGVCRSDWHAWRGHDADVSLPHIPGHELAGVVAEVAPGVRRFRVGDRVTVPFILSCGACPLCLDGHTQVCPNQRQPGSSLPGSFAERVAITGADHNLVALPEAIDFALAAGLGCRVATAYHAIRARGRVQPGEQVAIFGAGGVGLSAVVVARAAGAEVVAVDRSDAALAAARDLGAQTVPAGSDAADRVRELTDGGAHLALDALGSRTTLVQSIQSLRPRGRHVQVGLLAGADADPPVPMGRVIALELELLGSHGIAASGYAQLLDDIVAGRLPLAATVGRTIGFDELSEALQAMDGPPTTAGITVALLGSATG